MQQTVIKPLPNNELVQLKNPYFSTIAFEQYLKANGCFRSGTTNLDVATGLGANLHYFKQMNPEVNFLGVDYNPRLIEKGTELINARNFKGVRLETQDCFALPDAYVGQFDGITSIHALCCFKQIEKPLASFCRLQPRWIGINSLFYDGPLDVLIHIRELDMPEIQDNDPDGDFNIFSLQKTQKFFENWGYQVRYQAYHPPKPLPRKEGNKRGTYTMKTELHEHSQFSGPVYLPWYFLIATKNKGLKNC